MDCRSCNCSTSSGNTPTPKGMWNYSPKPLKTAKRVIILRTSGVQVVVIGGVGGAGEDSNLSSSVSLELGFRV